MRNVGTISESRRSSKVYPLVSDSLFEGKVKLEELTPAGKQAAALRAKEKASDAAGAPGEAGKARGARQHNIATRRARPRVSPAGRVPGKRYREDPVESQTPEMKKRMPKKGGGS